MKTIPSPTPWGRLTAAVLAAYAIGLFNNEVRHEMRIKEAMAAMAVIDNTNLAQNAITAAKTAEMLIKETEQLDMITKLLKTFGQSGSGGATSRVLMSTESGGGGLIGGGRAYSNTISDSIMGEMRGQPGMGGMSSPDMVQKVIASVLGGGPNLTPPQARNLENQRFRTASTAQDRALADAVFHSHSARAELDNLYKMADEARAATAESSNLRTQISVLSGINIKAVEELAQLRMLLSSFIAMQSSRGIASLGASYVPATTARLPWETDPAAAGTPPSGGGVFQ